MTRLDLSSFRSVLCLNGELPNKKFFSQFNCKIIAADGAGSSLINQGIIPNIIIGDFDSFVLNKLPNGVDYLKNTDASSTDFEKCIIEMKEQSLFPAIIVGAFGKEADHALFNLHCLIKHGRTSQMIFYNHLEREAPQYCIPIYSDIEFKCDKGDIISLLPYPMVKLTTTGLSWKLKDDTLDISGMSSIRNRAVSNYVKIEVHTGQFLLVIPSKKLNLSFL